MSKARPVAVRPAPALWRAYPYTAAAIAIAVFWLLLMQIGIGKPALLFSLGRTPILAMASALAIYAAYCAHGRERLSWLFIGAAVAMIMLGELTWAHVFISTGKNPVLGFSDAFYLSYFPLIFIGLLAVPRTFQGRFDVIRFILDAGIVVLGGGLLVWYFAIRPALGASNPEHGLNFVAMAYPLGNLLTLVAMASVLLRLPLGDARRVYLLLGCSLLASLTGDLIWVVRQVLTGDQEIGLWSRLSWLTQSVILVAAGDYHRLHHGSWLAQRRESRASFPALPYVALILGYGTIGSVAVFGALSDLRALLVGGFLLTVCIVLRQALAHHETMRLQSDQARLASESKLAKLIENAAEGIVVLNPNYRVLYASPAVGRLLKTSAMKLIDRSMLEFLVPDDADSLRQVLAELDRDTGRASRKLMLRLLPPNAGLIWVEATLSDRRRDPELAGIVVNIRDVTEHHRLEEQIRYEALHDALTQLPTRELFLDRASRALNGAAPGVFAIAVLDLNQLRQINDSLGHSFGDQALILAADRLRAVFGTDTALARLSAEEFAVLLESAAIDTRVEHIHAAFSEPFSLGKHRMPIELSIGVAVSRAGTTAHELLRDADTACTKARARSKSKRYELFVVEQHEQAMAWLALQSTLPDALASGRFSVHLEPIVSLIDGFPFGLRPRLRWSDPQTAAFPIERVREVIASGNEIGIKMGAWVIAAAQKEYASVLRFMPGAASLSLLVPIHTAQLLAPDLSERTRHLLNELGIPPVNLIFSVTEASLVLDQGAGLDRLRELRTIGVRLALAEFGGRGSSLSALQEPIFDTILLARELVARLGPGSRANALVRGVIAAGESVGTRVIAAGVDSEAQKNILIDQGCLYGVGQALAKPMAAEYLLPWLGARFAEREA